jgi:hypothetical protein
VLAFSFTVKHQFVAKIDSKWIFHSHEAHITERLHIMVMYKKLMVFLNLNFASKFKCVSFDSTVKHQFIEKTEWNSIFFCCKIHILD